MTRFRSNRTQRLTLAPRWAGTALLVSAAVLTACGGPDTTDITPPPPPPPAPRFSLSFDETPGKTFADSALAPFRVSVRDSAGAVHSIGTWNITISLVGSGGAVLSGTTTSPSVSGQVTFANVRVSKSGSYTLRAEASGPNAPTPAASAALTIMAAPAVFDPLATPLTSDSLQASQGVFTYQLSGPAPKLEPGSVIAGPQFGGYLRRVRSVSQTGNTLTVETDPAVLTDVVREGSLRVSQPVAISPGARADARAALVRWAPAATVALAPGVTVGNGVLHFDDVVLWQRSNDGLVLRNGQLALDPRIDLELDIRNWTVERLLATLGATATFDADFWLGASNATSLQRPVIPVATISRPFSALIGGWTVWGRVILTFSLVAELSTDAEISVTQGVTTSGNLLVGARYDAAGWQDLSTVGATHLFKPVSVAARGAASIRVGAKLEARLLLYESLGPNLWAEPWIRGQVAADLVQNTWSSSCTAGVTAGLGFSVNLFGLIAQDFTTQATFAQASSPVCTKSGPINPAQTLRISTGNNQQAMPGAALQPFVVTVTDFIDRAVPDVAVDFAVQSGGGSLSATRVMTDANGVAQATLTLGPLPGVHAVQASVAGAAGSPQLFTATALNPVGAVVGTAVDDATGQGLAGAEVYLEAGGTLGPYLTLPSGVFAVTQIPPGFYTVRVLAVGYQSAVKSNVQIRAGLTTDAGIFRLIKIQKGDLGGTVRNAATSGGIAAALVDLWPGFNNLAGTPQATAVANGLGVYQFAGLPAGFYTARARATGFLTGSGVHVNVVPDASTLLDLLLSPVPLPPVINAVTPSTVTIPTAPNCPLSGTFRFTGQNFLGTDVTTTAPIALVGSARVNAAGTQLDKDFQIGCGAATGTFQLRVRHPLTGQFTSVNVVLAAEVVPPGIISMGLRFTSRIMAIRPNGAAVFSTNISEYLPQWPRWRRDGQGLGFTSGGEHLGNGVHSPLHFGVLGADGSGPFYSFEVMSSFPTTPSCRHLGFTGWSPNNQQLLFVRNCQPSFADENYVAVINTDGTGARVLFWAGRQPNGLSRELYRSVDWSPDGNSLLVVVWDLVRSAYDLVTMDLAGGSRRTLLAGANISMLGGVNPDQARWSPDGSMIAYTKYTQFSGPGEVHLARPDGTGDRLVYTGSPPLIAWSPNGAFLAVADRQGPSSNPCNPTTSSEWCVYTLNLTTLATRLIARTPEPPLIDWR